MEEVSQWPFDFSNFREKYRAVIDAWPYWQLICRMTRQWQRQSNKIAEIGQNKPEFRVLHAKKYTGLKKMHQCRLWPIQAMPLTQNHRGALVRKVLCIPTSKPITSKSTFTSYSNLNMNHKCAKADPPNSWSEKISYDRRKYVTWSKIFHMIEKFSHDRAIVVFVAATAAAAAIAAVTSLVIMGMKISIILRTTFPGTVMVGAKVVTMTCFISI